MVEEIPDPENRRRFINSCISIFYSSEIICDQYPAGFTIDSFIYIISVTFIRGHSRECKINRNTLIWLCGNTSGTTSRCNFGHLILDTSGTLIKYSRTSVAEIFYSINIFVRIIEVLITRMDKLLVPYKILSGRPELQVMDRIRLFHKFLKRNHIDPASR